MVVQLLSYTICAELQLDRLAGERKRQQRDRYDIEGIAMIRNVLGAITRQFVHKIIV